MRLTPLDIRKQEFKKGMRGIDTDEVYAFLATVADEYEAALNDNKALRERLLELDDKVQEYRNMEKTLRDTLLTAERITVEAKDNARREAELIIKQAELDADKGVRDIKSTATRLRHEIRSLKNQRESYLARMKMLVETHMKFLETAEHDFEEDEQTFDRDMGQSTPTDAQRPNPVASAMPADNRSDDSTGGSGSATQQTAVPTPQATPQPTPLPEATPETPGAHDDARAETGRAADTLTEPDPNERLNELLDRVVQQTTSHTREIPEADTPTVAQAEPASHIVPPSSEAPAPPSAPQTDGESMDEWSLEQLKNDILARRHGKDETIG